MYRVGPKGMTFVGTNRQWRKVLLQLDRYKSMTLKQFCEQCSVPNNGEDL